MFSLAFLGAEERIWTSAALFTRPTPLAGEPLRPLGYFCKYNIPDNKVAERVGFEPTEACTSPVFKTGSFNRSDISPQRKGAVLYRTPDYYTIPVSILSTSTFIFIFLIFFNLGVAFPETVCYYNWADFEQHFPGVAQLVARLTGGQEAVGSSPATRTISSVLNQS